MRAFRLHEFGAAPQIDALPRPAPGPGEVLIRIAGCGLNFADLLVIKGTYQEKPKLPATLGMEFAGTVEAVGDGVETPATGARVAAYTGGGGLADYAVVPADRCIPMPQNMTFEEAAGFLVAYGTSHLALDHRARLQPGESLLVLGAAGGVGLTAVQIGKAMGARVIACARGAEKLAIAEAAGADSLIDSATADIRASVRALGGADVVYDPVGGEGFDAALRATRPGGRILTVGFASGTIPQIPANYLLVKNIDVVGLYWGGYLSFDPARLDASLATLFDWYAAGRLTPHVSHVLPLDKAAEGLELLRGRRSTGKVVITP